MFQVVEKVERFGGSILSDPKIVLDIDPKELAKNLILYATDWETSLSFLVRLGVSMGIYVDGDEVAKLIREEYKLDERQ